MGDYMLKKVKYIEMGDYFNRRIQHTEMGDYFIILFYLYRDR